ncbi:protein phosphatase CheZ, partial [Paracraurococcus lichenis]
RPEAIGSALVNGKPVELLNASYFVDQAARDWFQPRRKASPKDAAPLSPPDTTAREGTGEWPAPPAPHQVAASLPPVSTLPASTPPEPAVPDPQSILDEINAMKGVLDVARREMVGLTPHLFDENSGGPNTALDTVVVETERATLEIMQQTEKLQITCDRLVAGVPESAADLAVISDAALAIVLACSFQDITGQRLRRVIRTLQDFDLRIATLMRLLDVRPDERPSAQPEQASLLNGPSLPGGSGLEQQAVDDLFA